MICFDNVTKRYGVGHDALRDVSFTLDSGGMVFLTGHSGAGKSTLLKVIMLLERPTRGRAVVGDNDLGVVEPSQIPYLRQQIGVVFQNHHLLFDRTVFDNVALPLRISGVPEREQAKRTRAALDKVGLLRKEQVLPVSLSSGEQQRVGIARAVVNKPAILLADEPTGNLDPDLSLEIMRLFRDFHQVGVTVLIATHAVSLIESFDCSQIRLSEGCLLPDGR